MLVKGATGRLRIRQLFNQKEMAYTRVINESYSTEHWLSHKAQSNYLDIKPH